jgi:hypothetical protein
MFFYKYSVLSGFTTLIPDVQVVKSCRCCSRRPQWTLSEQCQPQDITPFTSTTQSKQAKQCHFVLLFKGGSFQRLLYYNGIGVSLKSTTVAYQITILGLMVGVEALRSIIQVAQKYRRRRPVFTYHSIRSFRQHRNKTRDCTSTE